MTVGQLDNHTHTLRYLQSLKNFYSRRPSDRVVQSTTLTDDKINFRRPMRIQEVECKIREPERRIALAASKVVSARMVLALLHQQYPNGVP